MIMYQLVRRVHLFTGLGLLLFVLMYFFTGYVIIHGKWFGQSESKTSVRTETMEAPPGLSEEGMSIHLQERFDLRGQRGAVNHRPDGSARFTFGRPGTAIEALVAPGGRQVTITERKFDFRGTANGFHRLRGYRGGAFYLGWTVLYDLASAALILFAITGIFLWYKSTARRWPGLLCLAASFGFTASMVIYLLVRR
jgi:hypothetical protein